MEAVAKRVRAIVGVALALWSASVAGAQDTSGRVAVVELRDGSRVVGALVKADADSVVVSGSLGRVAIARAQVARMRTLSAAESSSGKFTLPPHSSRLIFAPTARVQTKGDAYISNHFFFLFDGSAGLGHRASLGGGFSLVPGVDVSDNLFYALPKFGLVQRENLNVAAGALIGGTSVATDDAISVGVAYGVLTIGPPTRSVTFGAGWGYLQGDWASRPVILAGGELRLNTRVALVSEDYFLPGSTGAVVSLAFRMYGERMSGDLGLMTEASTGTVPIPVVGLTIRF